MTKIVKVYAREVLDSRGNPTVEVEVHSKMVHWVEQLFQVVLPQVKVKLWN